MLETNTVKKIFQFSAGWILIALLLVGMLQIPVSAQSTGLRINPRVDLTVKPGETQSGSLLLSNLNKDVDITVDLRVVDFKAAGETGIPTPILEEYVDPTPWSLRPYMKVPAKVTLKKGETKYIPYSVRIPGGVGAGSYYSAIKYDPKPALDGETTVNISGSPMQLVFVTIPGKATELMNLHKFGTYTLDAGKQDGKFQSVFITKAPERFAYRLENVGNVAESPSGSIIVKNIFGKQVFTVEDANPKKNLALIGQIRRFDVCIQADKIEVQQDQGTRTSQLEVCKNPGLLPGIYTAQLTMLYGINGSNTQEINARTLFVYMPYWALAILLVVIGILAYIIYRIRQRLVGRTSHSRKR